MTDNLKTNSGDETRSDAVATAPADGSVPEAAGGPGPTRRRSRLREDFGLVFTGNVVAAACQFGLYMVLTKLAAPASLGYYTLGVSIATPLLTLGNLNLRALLATDAKEEYAFSQYLAIRVLTTAAACLVVICVAVFQGSIAAAAIMLCVGLGRSVHAIADIFLGQFQHCYRMKWIMVSRILRGVGGLTAVYAMLRLTGNDTVAIAAMALMWGLVLIGFEYPAARSLGHSLPTFRPWRPLGRIALLGLPLGVSTMIVSLSVYLPRYFILAYCGQVELGRFGAISAFLIMALMIVGALGQAAAPRLAQRYHKDLRSFVVLLIKLVVLGTGLGLLGVVAAVVVGKEILSIAFTPEYRQYSNVLVWIMVAAGVQCVSVFLGTGATAARVLKPQLYITIARALVVLALCWWLIPAMGLVGGAVAIVAGGVIASGGMAIAMVWAIRKRQTVGETPTKSLDAPGVNPKGMDNGN